MTKRTTEPGEPRSDLPGEKWKPVPIAGLEKFFEFSNFGRVYRLDRIGRDGRTIRSRHIAVSTNNGKKVAYLPINARRCRAFYIEKAIMEAWPPEQPEWPKSHRGEQWRPIEDYFPGSYLISNLGRVYVFTRLVNDGRGRNRLIRGRILSPNGRDSNGYPKVDLGPAGKQATVLIHRLVAKAFVENPNPNLFDVVHHKDEDKTNPRANNLEWTTSAANVRDWFNRRGETAIRTAAKILGIPENDLRAAFRKK